MGDESSSSESFDSDISISEDPIPSSSSSTTTTTTTTTATATTSPVQSPFSSGEFYPLDSRSKQGYIEIRGANKKNKIISKWRLSWCLLDGGSLFIYKNYEKGSPYMTVEMTNVRLGDKQHDNRQFSFPLFSLATPPSSPSPSPSSSPVVQANNAKSGEEGEKLILWLAYCTELELEQWRNALNAARSLETVPVPISRPIPSSQRTQTSLYRIKKSVAGRAATSKMGEVLLMKMFGDEIHHLFLSVKKIMTKHHSKEVASRVHKILIRLTIKIAFLFEKKILNVSVLAEVDRPMREAMELLSKFYNAKVRRSPKPFPVDETFARIEKLSKQAEEELVRRVQPYISPKNLANIHYLFETIANGPFLRKVFSDPDMSEELDELDDVITAYTQVHI